MFVFRLLAFGLGCLFVVIVVLVVWFVWSIVFG